MARWLMAGLLVLAGTGMVSAQQGLWEVYQEAGTSAIVRGYTAEAEKIWKTALDVAAKDGAKGSYATATMDKLAVLYIEQERLPEAEAMFKKLLEVNEAAHGKECQQVADCCSELGEFYRQQFGNRDADAEPYLRRSLAIQSKDPNLITVYGPGMSLFQCLLFQNKLADAETTVRWCMAVVEKNTGPLQPRARVACLHGMAMIHYKRKQDADALSAYRLAVESLEKAVGPEDPSLLWSLYHVGNFYHTLLGNSAQAEFFYAKALAIGEKTGAASAGQTAQILLALGQIYHKQHQDAQAQRCFDRALELADKLPSSAMPADKIGVAVLRLQVVPYYLDQGKFDDADKACKKALASIEEIRGVPKKELGRCYRGLADCCLAQNKAADADAYAHKALDADEKCLGPAHGFYALDLCRLAHVARLRNQDADAEKFCRLAMPIAEHEIGITRPEAREVVDEYLALLRKMNRAAEAQQVENHAVKDLKLPAAAAPAAPAAH